MENLFQEFEQRHNSYTRKLINLLKDKIDQKQFQTKDDLINFIRDSKEYAALNEKDFHEIFEYFERFYENNNNPFLALQKEYIKSPENQLSVEQILLKYSFLNYSILNQILNHPDYERQIQNLSIEPAEKKVLLDYVKQEKQQEGGYTNAKTKVLSNGHNLLPDQEHGFINALVLATLTLSFGIVCLTYVFFFVGKH